MNRPIPCRVCSSREAAFVCQVGNEHSATEQLDVYSCLACGSVYVGSAVTPAELAVAYGSQSEEEVYYAEIAKPTQAKFDSSARDLARLIPASASVLDLGAGDGGFLRTLRRQGFRDLAAHEIPGHDMARLRMVADRIYNDTDYLTVPDASFDAVTLLDVLEHVHDPQATVRACARILRPGGMLYLHTPCVSRLDRIMHAVARSRRIGKAGRTWQRGRTSIFHLQNFSVRGLALMLGRAGLTVERLETRNELSWPIARYVKVYVLEKQGLPAWPARLLAPLLWPLLKTRINANKAIAVASRTSERAGGRAAA